MKGTHAIHVTGRKTDFKFEVRRSITIVRGDSGTGKTTLYDLIASHTRLGEVSGVTIQCEKRCVALVDIDWKNQLSSVEDSIVFIILIKGYLQFYCFTFGLLCFSLHLAAQPGGFAKNGVKVLPFFHIQN